jgi:CheY-like chemotaxis protein
MRVTVLVACCVITAAAGCSSRSAASAPPSASAVARPLAMSAVHEESFPGVGASRAYWDASHTPNAANDDGSAYGNDPSLPSYLAPSGAVYSSVGDQGTGRIQFYDLNMPTVDGVEALRRVRRELPADATAAWDLPLDQCYRRAFNSSTLQAAGHYMADVQFEYIQEDGSRRSGPDSFNHAWIWLDTAGSPPNPESDCSMWTS